jgi:hypothetical protein
MDSNPYASPVASSAANEAIPFWRRIQVAFAGLLCGGLCGAITGFVAGSLNGLIYRLMHDVTWGGAGIFGLFERVSTPIDFALYHGTTAAVPLLLIGCSLGFFQGLSAARRPLGLLGIVGFASLNALIGALNGADATGGPDRLLRQVIEGPLTGILLGAALGTLAWWCFRIRINDISQSSRSQLGAFNRAMLLIDFGALLLFVGMVPVLYLGPGSRQLAKSFGMIALLGVLLCILGWFAMSKAKRR